MHYIVSTQLLYPNLKIKDITIAKNYFLIFIRSFEGLIYLEVDFHRSLNNIFNKGLYATSFHPHGKLYIVNRKIVNLKMLSDVSTQFRAAPQF